MVWEAARVALTDFHQLPSWNPYHCGGVVLYQDPQAPFPGPLFLLTFFWLPAIVALKVWEIIHLIAAAFGAESPTCRPRVCLIPDAFAMGFLHQATVSPRRPAFILPRARP
jgi:hypothetical protein